MAVKSGIVTALQETLTGHGSYGIDARQNVDDFKPPTYEEKKYEEEKKFRTHQ